MDIKNLRRHYSMEVLDEAHTGADPFIFFRKWFLEAMNAGILEPNAMVLSTIGLNQIPQSRVVLLKGLEKERFIFFTNYLSDKGKEIEQNPLVALNFNWLELERQIRVEGKAVKVSPQESDEYFYSRPKGSRIGAWVSEQSTVIKNRSILDEKLKELESFYADREVPRPEWWGGYAVEISAIEFWQGRPNRLHDRIRFRRSDQMNWIIERLSP